VGWPHNVNSTTSGDKVVAFHRWDGGGPHDDLVILINNMGIAAAGKTSFSSFLE
jgi:hypothetical protein